MSHAATNWAIEAVKGKGLNWSAKGVLWHLADRYNKDHGCFPSQETLAADCELSRSQLNVHLDILEEKGLIRRVRRLDSQTKKRRSTRYLLAFEEGFEPLPCAANDEEQSAPQHANPCPEIGQGSGDEAMSGNGEKPCPEIGDSHVRKSDTNPVREPVREPCVQVSDSEHTSRESREFREFWEAHPRPRDLSSSAALFKDAVARGASARWIIESAKRYRTENAENGRMYIAYSDNWLRAERWRDFEEPSSQGAKPIDLQAYRDAASLFASKIREGRYVAPSAISAGLAAEIVGRGLATEDEMVRAGFRV